MSITMLLVAAARENDQVRYADPNEVRALTSVANANARGIYPFVHTFEPELALAWLTRALTYTPAGYEARNDEGKYEYTLGLWTAVGNFFRAANLRMYGWEPLRLAFERVLGAPPRGTPEYLRGKIVDRLPGRYGGAWRVDAVRLYAAAAPSEAALVPDAVTFGLPRDFALDSMGCNISVSEAQAEAGYGSSVPGVNDTCTNPTGEQHRLWWQSNGVVRGNKADLYRTASSGRTGWVSNPVVYFPNDRRLFWIPGLRSYFDLAREIAQALEVAISKRDLVTFIRDVKHDVILRNSALSDSFRLPQDQLAQASLAAYARELSDQMRTAGIVDAAGRSVAGLAGEVTPLAGIIGGGLSLLTSAIVRAAISRPDRYIDVFGRPTPAPEVFAGSDTVAGSVSALRDVSWPEGVTLSDALAPPDPDAVQAAKEREAYEAGKAGQRERDRQGNPVAPPPGQPPPPARGGDGAATVIGLGLLGGAGYIAWKKRAALKRALTGRS